MGLLRMTAPEVYIYATSSGEQRCFLLLTHGMASPVQFVQVCPTYMPILIRITITTEMGIFKNGRHACKEIPNTNMVTERPLHKSNANRYT
jgi:hypothetical protein